MKKFARDARRLAQSLGIEKAEIIIRKRGHPAIHGEYAGRPISVTIPGTPSDKRCIANMTADLRRTMRLAAAKQQG